MDADLEACVLLVDDEPRNLFALSELLGGLTRHLLLARSGQEALRHALEHDLAVVLLDVLMPGVNGIETARLLRARERSRLTPIIFLTAAADEMESVFRGYEVGAVDYLVKPLVPELLRSKVSVFIELQKRRAELARQVAEREAAEKRALESETKLRALAARLLSVREQERAHIAREIHDELGQVLTGLKMEVSWLAKRFQDPSLLEKTRSMSELIDASIQTVRKIATGLRPEVLDAVGLVGAIGWQAKDFQKRTGIRCRLSLPEESKSYGRELSTAVFRIFQEVLTNVARHSRATRVDVALSDSADRLLLEVRDNGIGLSSTELNGKAALGLLGMRERALGLGGVVEFDGASGRGMRVSVLIPLAKR